jgi:predicted RNase H-like nuclease (RuvC/YqgF family)
MESKDERIARLERELREERAKTDLMVAELKILRADKVEMVPTNLPLIPQR